eukprot:3066944-Prymnesium_polylepis.1
MPVGHDSAMKVESAFVRTCRSASVTCRWARGAVEERCQHGQAWAAWIHERTGRHGDCRSADDGGPPPDAAT